MYQKNVHEKKTWEAEIHKCKEIGQIKKLIKPMTVAIEMITWYL